MKTAHFPAAGESRLSRTLRALLLIGAVVAGLLVSSLISAQGAEQSQSSAADEDTPAPQVYQPAGAPADPKVDARWNYYRDYEHATELLKQLAAAHPDLCRLESLGKSHGGREMWLLTMTNFKSLDDGKELERPAFWIDGGIHANEVRAVDVVLYTAWYLAETYRRQERPSRLLDERIFYMVPMMSPDSRDAHMYRPNTTHSPRGGQRPVDDDRDGRVNEDGPDDLDGDGHITQMRIRDPNGRLKPHPRFEAMMIDADPDERGSYMPLGQEGYDNDGDGRVNEDGDGYYDPNRDWAWQWQPDFIQGGAHRYPFSIEENRMVADFVLAHPNIAGAQSYHNTGGMILRGPGVRGETWPREDIRVYDRIGQRGAEMLPGYRYINTAEDLYQVYGGETDWFYAMRGVIAFTNELNTPFNLFRKATEGGYFARGEDLRKFNEYLLLGDGFVPWKEVDHPQYGKIEVGGVKKNWGRQPPSFMIEEECHRNMAFTFYHADQMPQVEIDAVDVERIEDGLTQVTATIVNRKAIPTHTAFDVERKITPPDVVTIAGDDLQVFTAVTSGSLLFEPDDVNEYLFGTPKEQEREPEAVRLETIPSMEAVYVRWLVRGNGIINVTVRSPKGGVAQATAELK